MKKNLSTILLTLVTGLLFGYFFVLSWMIGLLASRYVAGKSSGESGRWKSVIIPFRKWRIHLHHWLYSLLLLGLSAVSGLHFLTPAVTYGLLAGTIFQGIYYYDDWHVIVLSRKSGKKPDPKAGG